MRRKSSIGILAAVFLAASIGPSVAPMAADGETDRNVVVDVRVEGVRHLSTGAVLAYVRTRIAQRYDPEVVKADQQRLQASGRFRGVVATMTRTAKGVIVTFTVQELPQVQQLRFVGNKAIKADTLAKELSFGVSDPLSWWAVEGGRQDIQKKYREEGYHFARVTFDAEAMKSDQVVYLVVEGPKVTIRKIRFKGNDHFGNFRLRQTTRSRPRLWPFISGNLDIEQVERDVDAIRGLYLEEGFLDVEVARMPVFSPDKRKVTLTFVIREGTRYRVNQVRFRGNTVFTDRELAGRLTLARGEYFTALALRRDAQEIESTYGRLGFLHAKVGTKNIFLDPTRPPPDWAKGITPRPALLNVIFEVREEDQYTVGEIRIRGNTVTQDRVIRRQLRFMPEQLFNTAAVDESRRRLQESRLFEKVDILPTGTREGERDVLVQVAEGRTAHFLIGAGVSSNSGLLGNVSFKQSNFDLMRWPNSWGGVLDAWRGAGQTLSIVAEPGVELMRFHVEWFEPYLFDQPYSLGAKLFVFTRERDDYDETRYGAVASLGHRFKNRWYGELAARIEGIELSNLDRSAAPEIRAEAGKHAIVGLKGTLVRDRTDSRWLPSDGDRFRLAYEQVVGDFNFGRSTADYRIYRTVYVDATDRKHILAGRASMGHIFGDAPVFEKFYGGGIGSVRGFDYRGISPRSKFNDDPIGGDTMFFAGMEYSFPVIGKAGEPGLRGVLFLDSGTVEEDYKLTTYRAAVGFGVRWTVSFFGPVPISLDFAFPLNKDEDDETQIFSFTLGWNF